MHVEDRALVFVVGWLASIVAIEILRPIVHQRRERARGIGGTQDIACGAPSSAWPA